MKELGGKEGSKAGLRQQKQKSRKRQRAAQQESKLGRPDSDSSSTMPYLFESKPVYADHFTVMGVNNPRESQKKLKKMQQEK